MNDLPVLLTVKAASHHSGLSRSQLYRWLKAGVIKAKKCGSSTLIETASLQQAIAALPDYR